MRERRSSRRVALALELEVTTYVTLIQQCFKHKLSHNVVDLLLHTCVQTHRKIQCVMTTKNLQFQKIIQINSV